MSRLGGFSSREIIKVAERNGWRLLRVRGDYFTFGKDGVRDVLTVPAYDSISEAVTRRLIRTMDLSVDEFLRQARK